MLVYHLFSDASVKRGCAGYCVALHTHGKETEYLSGYLPEIIQSVPAEFAALAIGVASCPPCDRLVIWSDLNYLPLLMEHPYIKRTMKRSIRQYVGELRELVTSFSEVEYRLVDRGNETYRRCHKLSRLAAIDLMIKTRRWRGR